MQTGSRRGMQTMEQSLTELVQQKIITVAEAVGRSSRPEALLSALERAGIPIPDPVQRRHTCRHARSRRGAAGGRELAANDSVEPPQRVLGPDRARLPTDRLRPSTPRAPATRSARVRPTRRSGSVARRSAGRRSTAIRAAIRSASRRPPSRTPSRASAPRSPSSATTSCRARARRRSCPEDGRPALLAEPGAGRPRSTTIDAPDRRRGAAGRRGERSVLQARDQLPPQEARPSLTRRVRASRTRSSMTTSPSTRHEVRRRGASIESSRGSRLGDESRATRGCRSGAEIADEPPAGVPILQARDQLPSQDADVEASTRPRSSDADAVVAESDVDDELAAEPVAELQSTPVYKREIELPPQEAGRGGRDAADATSSTSARSPPTSQTRPTLEPQRTRRCDRRRRRGSGRCRAPRPCASRSTPRSRRDRARRRSADGWPTTSLGAPRTTLDDPAVTPTTRRRGASRRSDRLRERSRPSPTTTGTPRRRLLSSTTPSRMSPRRDVEDVDESTPRCCRPPSLPRPSPTRTPCPISRTSRARMHRPARAASARASASPRRRRSARAARAARSSD